jgi:uncharacterized membrane protein YjgN (DUF898 family)
MMEALRFEGKGFEYFKIWIVNIILTILTLSLYHPWAKVRNARYFYANSKLEDRNFEYHATGKQLFIGYLITLVLVIAYVILQQVSPIGSFVAIGVLFIAFPWIIWRSMKFNMRITSFSNVRFGFVGGLGGSYFNYMFLPALILIALYLLPLAMGLVAKSMLGSSIKLATAGTLVVTIVSWGLAVYIYGLMKKKNAKYMLNSSRYGQGKFFTDVQTAPFVIILLKTIGLFILAVAIMLLVAALGALSTGLGSDLMQLVPNLDDPQAMEETFGNPMVIALIALLYIGFIFIAIAVFSYSYARQRKYIYENTKLDGVIAFASSLGARKIAWVSVTNMLLVILTLGLATPWAKVRMARVLLENTHVDTSTGFDNYISQKQDEQSSLGEQLGDAFDVDVGIGL